MTEILLLISLACNILIMRIWDAQLERREKTIDELIKVLEQNNKDMTIISSYNVKPKNRGRKRKCK